MISYIKGTLESREEDCVIIDRDGIGWQVFVPASVLDEMPVPGTEVKIYTYLYVREDLLCLYGFLTRDDLKTFRQLITVSGIGPKGALGILSAMTPDRLRYAVLTDDVKAISKAPGIGTKTAQRLIIELKDKMKVTLETVTEDLLTGADSDRSDKEQGANPHLSEAMMALTALGYTRSESSDALKRIEIKPEMNTDEIIRLVLRNIF